MKKKVFFAFALLCFLMILTASHTVYAADEDPLYGVDLDVIEDFFDSLDESSRTALGGSVEEFAGRLKRGETIDFQAVLRLILGALSSSVGSVAPYFTSVLGMIILIGVLSGIRSDFGKEGVQSVLEFAFSVLIGGLIIGYVASTINEASRFLRRVSELISVAFPVLFTLLLSLGATATTTALQPFVSFFAELIGLVISKIVLPLAVIGIVMSVLSGVSVGFNVKKFNDLILSFAKSVIFSVFFVFSVFLGVQGVVAGVYDGVAARIARFSLGKYVPIIGGYLSEGLNMILAGTVLLKNGVGAAFILLILIIALPVILKTAVLTGFTKVLAVVSSPFECRGVTGMLEGVGKSLNIIISSLFAVTLSALVMSVVVVLSANTVV